MKKILMTAVVLCSWMTMTVFTACGSDDDETPADSKALVINLDSVVIKPYLAFGSSVADAEQYIKDTFSDYEAWESGELEPYDQEDAPRTYFKEYVNGNRSMSFCFDNADGTNLVLVSYDYFFPVSKEPVMAELERNGFVYKGEVRFADYNADHCYLYLSADGTLEVQFSTWKKDGGSWALSFQPVDKNDLNHLI